MTVTHTALPGHVLRTLDAKPRETIARFIERSEWNFKLPTICIVNGSPVLRKDWRRTKIKAEDRVTFLSRPMGGRGSSSKSVIGLLAMIALAAFAPWAGAAVFGAGTLGASLMSGAIRIGGKLDRDLLNAPLGSDGYSRLKLLV